MNRGAFTVTGGAALALAWSPAPALVFGHGFAAHMTSHMMVVAIAAPLLALGLVGSRSDPSLKRPALFAAVPVSLVELVVVWGWHAPAAHDLARSNGVAYVAEQASFLAAGLWLWIACLGHGGSRPAAAQGVIGMLLTSIHMTLLGVLLSTTTITLYAAHHGDAAEALHQQHVGGVVMLLVGGGVYLAGGLALAARLLREDEAPLPPPPCGEGSGVVQNVAPPATPLDVRLRRLLRRHPHPFPPRKGEGAEASRFAPGTEAPGHEVAGRFLRHAAPRRAGGARGRGRRVGVRLVGPVQRRGDLGPLADHRLVPALRHDQLGQDALDHGRDAEESRRPGADRTRRRALRQRLRELPRRAGPAAQPGVIREMVPTAPDLDAKVPTWEPKHLFWIVKNGVKYAGMPAWVSAEEREDEVWAVVAFLLKLPGMSDESYRRLAMGAENDGAVGGLTALAHRAQGRGPREDVLADCARCHGRDGMGRDGDAFPVIAGQSEDYIYDALAAYAQNKRYSGVMETAAARLPYSDIAALAEYYAAQPRKPIEDAKPLDPALVARGEKIAREGLRDTGTPACSSCHGPGKESPNPAYPKLAGQHASYLETQLTLWEKEHDSRGGGPFAGIMRKIAFGMTEADIKAVAAYYASLPARE